MRNYSDFVSPRPRICPAADVCGLPTAGKTGCEDRRQRSEFICLFIEYILVEPNYRVTCRGSLQNLFGS